MQAEAVEPHSTALANLKEVANTGVEAGEDIAARDAIIGTEFANAHAQAVDGDGSPPRPEHPDLTGSGIEVILNPIVDVIRPVVGRDDHDGEGRWAIPEALGNALIGYVVPRDKGNIRDAHLIRPATEQVGETIRQDETEIMLSGEILEQSREREDDHGVQCTRTRHFHQLPVDQLKALAGHLRHVPEFFCCNQ